VVAWLVSPTIMLPASVFFSCFQFGYCASKSAKGLPGIDLIARGSMLLLSVRCYPDEAFFIASTLVSSSSSASSIIDLFLFAGRIHLACLVVSVAYHLLRCHKSEHLLVLLETLVVAATHVFLPPLISFSIYFNLVHLPRFLIRVSTLDVVRNQLKSKVFSQKQTLGSIVLTLVLIGVLAMKWFSESVAYSHSQSEDEGVTSFVMKTMFVVLSAASMPNMVVMIMLMREHAQLSALKPAMKPLGSIV